NKHLPVTQQCGRVFIARPHHASCCGKDPHRGVINLSARMAGIPNETVAAAGDQHPSICQARRRVICPEIVHVTSRDKGLTPAGGCETSYEMEKQNSGDRSS